MSNNETPKLLASLAKLLHLLVPNAALCWPPYFGIRLADHDGICMAHGTQGNPGKVESRQVQESAASHAR